MRPIRQLRPVLSTAVVLTTVLLLSTFAVQDAQDPAVAYRAAFQARDAAALGELWLAHPDRILTTIDADLEGSLAEWERPAEEADVEKIRQLQERALWGARIASSVTGRPIFADYASSFVGWNDEQKRAFRDGQAAFGRARQALRGGEEQRADALAAARECRELALPLGDWWGAAMGLSGEGQAHSSMGSHAEGLVASSQARLIYSQLGLSGSEYGCMKTMADQLEALERWPRLITTLEAAVELGSALGDTKGVAALEARLQAVRGR